MEILGLLIMFVGFGITFVGGMWLLVLAFQENILWGLAYMIIPFVSLVFLVMFWEDTKKPFLISLGGTLLMFCGALLGGVN